MVLSNKFLSLICWIQNVFSKCGKFWKLEFIMEFGSVEEANDLLSNGILVQTSKGLVCMSLNDALTSNLNLSVEDLQNVAAQLLLQQESKKNITKKDKPLISVQTVQAINSNFVLSDGLGDSDGFTSESSDANCLPSTSSTYIKLSKTPVVSSLKKDSKLDLKTKYIPVKIEHNIVEFSTDSFLSSNVSDSDTSSVVISTTKIEEKSINDPSKEPVETCKTAAKKRGGWPKGRKRKPELLHLPPKAPSTGYNLYLNDQRKLFKDSPLPFHEITKLIGNKWSSLRLDEKKPYLEKAEEEKRRYREELREYRQSGAYQLYLANKRQKRAKYNVLSESDMDATDDLDEEDNEELYCRTCDQYFHNLHNKREHLQGRQHMQSVAGAIRIELGSDYDTDCIGNASCISFSTSLDESSLDAVPPKTKVESSSCDAVTDYMNQLILSIGKRESEYKSLQRTVNEKTSNHNALYQQLIQLKERENKLKKDMVLLQEQEKDMELKVFHLWQVPSWFVITDLNQSNDEFIDNEGE